MKWSSLTWFHSLDLLEMNCITLSPLTLSHHISSMFWVMVVFVVENRMGTILIDVEQSKQQIPWTNKQTNEVITIILQKSRLDWVRGVLGSINIWQIHKHVMMIMMIMPMIYVWCKVSSVKDLILLALKWMIFLS
jgi:hypothetical protein